MPDRADLLAIERKPGAQALLDGLTDDVPVSAWADTLRDIDAPENLRRSQVSG